MSNDGLGTVTLHIAVGFVLENPFGEVVGSVPVIALMPASGAYPNSAVGVIAILAARGAARGKGSRAGADGAPSRTATRA